jgi:hypothetical protein
MRSALTARYYTSGRVLHLKNVKKHGMRQTGRHEAEDVKKIRRGEESLLYGCRLLG